MEKTFEDLVVGDMVFVSKSSNLVAKKAVKKVTKTQIQLEFIYSNNVYIKKYNKINGNLIGNSGYYSEQLVLPNEKINSEWNKKADKLRIEKTLAKIKVECVACNDEFKLQSVRTMLEELVSKILKGDNSNG